MNFGFTPSLVNIGSGNWLVPTDNEPLCLSQCWLRSPPPYNVTMPQWVNYPIKCPGMSSLWRHNRCDGVSNHQPHNCLLNRWFMRRSKKTSKLRVTGLSAGNSPVTGEFPAQMASNAENFSIWWRHHAVPSSVGTFPWHKPIHITSLWPDFHIQLAYLNSTPPGQNGRHFGRRHFQLHFLERNR